MIGTVPTNGPQLIDGLWLKGIAGGTNRVARAGLAALAGGAQAGATPLPAMVEIVEIDTDTAIGPVASVTVTNPGSGYTTATATVQSATGSGAVLTPVVAPIVTGAVTAVTVTAPGSGYTTATATITTTTGSGAVLTPVITGGAITGVTVTSAGSGYAPTDTVAITGDGTGATATLQVGTTGGTITGITVTSPGTNYATSDLVTITGDGTGAAASLVISSQPGSCMLPIAFEPGTLICVLNATANALAVFPNGVPNRLTGALDTLNGSTTTAYSIGPESLAWFACAKRGVWIGK